MNRFKDFEVLLGVDGVVRRIAKVRFAVDGSIYVFFPGFVSTQGILRRAKLHRGATYPADLDLSDGGFITSHLVKYAHHLDGEAHFSQDGKVKTVVRRQSVPLSEQKGHLFSIQAQNFSSFPILESPKKRQLTFNLSADISAVKITAWRFPVSEITFPENIPPGAVPIIRAPGGIDRMGLFVQPPTHIPLNDVLLFLAIEATPLLSKDNAAHLLFLGAFDHPSIALNHALDTEFIAFAYPCSDFEMLKERISSIDLVSAIEKSGPV